VEVVVLVARPAGRNRDRNAVAPQYRDPDDWESTGCSGTRDSDAMSMLEQRGVT
jgi:hypothetical protein